VTQTTGTQPTPGDQGWAEFTSYLSDRHGLVDLSEIGHGGMGRVYRARDVGLDRWVAVKVLRPEATGSGVLPRFRNEARLLGQLHHPAIVGVHFADVSPGGVAYFGMDYVEGSDLGTLLEDHRRRGDHYTVAQTVELLGSIASALDGIHDLTPRVIHRDVKPANILVPARPRAWAPAILTDFGISLSTEDTRMTSAGFLIGTDRYMAPEQFRHAAAGAGGGEAPGASTDLYAFALIAWEMLTLTPLRDLMGRNEWIYARRVPGLGPGNLAAVDRPRAGELSRVFACALADDPAQRFRTASGFLDALSGRTPSPAARSARPAPVVSATPTAQTRIRQQAPTAPAGRPRRALLTTVVVLLLIVIVVLGGLVFTEKVRSPAWSGAEATMAKAFPDLLPDRENGAGWRGMTCRGATPDPGQQARINCSGDGLSLVAADFGDSGNRDRFGSGSDLIGLSRDGCSTKVGRVAQAEGFAYVSLPQDGALSRYSLLLSGEGAQDDVQQMPVC
jgi:hypothetical protein